MFQRPFRLKIKCDVCDNNLYITYGKLYECIYCHFIRASDKDLEINASRIYNKNYFNKGDYFNYQSEKSALDANFKNRLKIIKSYISKGKLLEIGSANGYFVDLAKESFEVEGLECSIETGIKTQDRLGIKIYLGEFEKIDFSKKYDVIVALDVIEHIKFPRQFISKCYQLLNDNGYLFIETGDISAFLPRFQKARWRLIKTPEHLSYFSLSTLTTLLLSENLSVIKHYKVGFNRSLGQTFFRLYPSLYAKLPSNIQNSLTKYYFEINTRDLIFTVCQKLAI